MWALFNFTAVVDLPISIFLLPDTWDLPPVPVAEDGSAHPLYPLGSHPIKVRCLNKLILSPLDITLPPGTKPNVIFTQKDF
jgi:hypothetical protein